MAFFFPNLNFLWKLKFKTKKLFGWNWILDIFIYKKIWITGVFLWIKDPNPGDPKRPIRPDPDLDPQHWLKGPKFSCFPSYLFTLEYQTRLNILAFSLQIIITILPDPQYFSLKFLAFNEELFKICFKNPFCFSWRIQ